MVVKIVLTETIALILALSAGDLWGVVQSLAPSSEPGILETGAMVLNAVTIFIFFACKCEPHVLCDVEHDPDWLS